MNKMVFVLVFALFLSSCGSSPSTPVLPATEIVPTSVPTETPTVAPTATPVPTATLPPGWPVATLKIVSSLPMSSNAPDQQQALVNAVQLRLLQANNQACGGKYTLAYEPWDDATAAQGRWDPAAETANAKKAAADKSIIVYIGTFNSGAAKVSIPILDRAGPLVMISPANTYPGLTKPGLGTPGEPRIYYPAGVRNYTRVISTSDIQGKADANYMFTQLGVKTVYVLDDQEIYGIGVADVFVAAAQTLGIKVLGRTGINPQAPDYTSLMTTISTSNSGSAPDAIFAAIVLGSNTATLLSDKVTVMGDNTKVKFMGPDAIFDQSLIDNAGTSTSEGIYVSDIGLQFPDGLPDLGKQFMSDYEAKYGKLTEPFAVYAYELMSVALKAIEDVCAGGGDPTDRKQVLDAVFAIKDFNGALGTWSFDKNGDTSLTDMTIYQVKNGTFQAVGSSNFK